MAVFTYKSLHACTFKEAIYDCRTGVLHVGGRSIPSEFIVSTEFERELIDSWEWREDRFVDVIRPGPRLITMTVTNPMTEQPETFSVEKLIATNRPQPQHVGEPLPMKASEFCYWLQGYFEITDGETAHPGTLTPKQIETIRRHLSLVFKHELDAKHGDASHQAELQDIHDGKTKLPGDLKMRC